MAELLGQWQVATDANLNALPGALIYTYDSVATTTPKTTWQDPELTTPHANPIQADGSGKFPQIFGNIGDAYYLVLKTAAGVLVDDYEAVEALGSAGSGTFERDFDAGGRWKVSGSLGVIDMEFGPPEGDDVGGDFRLGGWDGTQAETAVIDAAATTFTGSIEAQSITVAGTSPAPPFPYLLTSGTATGSASIDITLPAQYSEYEVHVRDLRGTVATGLRGTLSFDNAGSYKTAADDYLNEAFYQGNSSFTNSPVAQGASMILGDSVVTSGTGGMDLVIRLISIAARETRAHSDWGQIVSGSAADCKSGRHTAGTNGKSYGKATNFRLAMNSGNLTCSYAVYGIR